MKTELTEEQLRLKQEFREFTDRVIVPHAASHDRDEKIHPSVLEGLKESGYIGSMVPTRYGGLGYDNITLGALNEEIGRGCASIRALLTVHGMMALALLRWGTAAQKDEWLPKLAKGEVIGAFGLSEENVGSDAKSVETTAVDEGDEYVLNGSKKWITFAQIADVFVIIARLNDKPTAFLVERTRPGFTTKAMSGLLGSRGSMLAEIFFENCRIPKENIIGNIDGGLTHVGLSCLDYGRYTVAWGCIGTAQACLEASIKYARERVQFGAPLMKNQLIQKMITEMITEIKVARLQCYHAGYLKDIGDPDTIMETWIAKYVASRMVNRVATDAVQIHGGNGVHSNYPVERYFRDAKINEIIEGTTQIHETLIARHAVV